MRPSIRHALGMLLMCSGWLGLLGAGPAAGIGSPAKAAASNAQRSSVSRLPGYVPLVDPESMAVVLGRRTNAPLVQRPFRNGARSLNDLGRRVVRHLHRAERDSLLGLCVAVEEFRDVMWREFPQSRPVTGLKWEDAWPILYARTRSGCEQAIGDYKASRYEFVRFERAPRPDSLFRYKNFTLHNGLVLVVRGEQGQLERWTWLRSVAERRGVFKIYSTTD